MAGHAVFVHGLWVTAASWDEFRAPFEAAGYTTHAPEWAVFAGRDAAAIRADLPPELGRQTLGMIADQMQAFIETLDAPPLIVGHSFGGLFAQMLLDRGLGKAGVALNPAPIAGVVPDLTALGGAAPAILRWAGWNRPYWMDKSLFHARFANGASRAFSDEYWDKYVVPAPGRLIHQAAFWLGSRVHGRARTQPLLITGGDADRLITPRLSRAAWRRQSRSPARTDYREFPGRSHLLCSEPGWEEVARAVIGWAESIET